MNETTPTASTAPKADDKLVAVRPQVTLPLEYAAPAPVRQRKVAWFVPLICALAPLFAKVTTLILLVFDFERLTPLLYITAALTLMSPLLIPVALLALLDCVATDRKDNGGRLSLGARQWTAAVTVILILEAIGFVPFLGFMAVSGTF